MSGIVCPPDLSRAEETSVIAGVLARLPYTTRLAIKFALDVQDHLPTGRTEDDATFQLRAALALAGVEG